MRLRDRAEASRKARAAKKKAEAAKMKAEMANHKGGPAPDRRDLLLWLPLGASIEDKSPLAHAAEAVGVSSVPDRTGKEDGACQFNSDSYLAVDGVADFNNLDEFTLSAWIGPTTRREHLNIISKVTPGRDFNLQLNAQGHVITHIENQGYEFGTSKSAVPLGEWTFVATTFKDREWKIYLNGQLDATQRVQKNPVWTGTLLTVGNLYPQAGEAFVGSLDDVRIYRKALSPAQIKTVMGS